MHGSTRLQGDEDTGTGKGRGGGGTAAAPAVPICPKPTGLSSGHLSASSSDLEALMQAGRDPGLPNSSLLEDGQRCKTWQILP